MSDPFRPRPPPKPTPIPHPPSASLITRELHFLTGATTPASLTPIYPALASKPSHRRSWSRTSFAPTSRRDGLTLSHWSRVGATYADPFAKFAKPSRIVSYNDEEYAAVLSNLKPVGPTTPLAPRTPAPHTPAPSPRLFPKPMPPVTLSGAVHIVPAAPAAGVVMTAEDAARAADAGAKAAEAATATAAAVAAVSRPDSAAPPASTLTLDVSKAMERSSTPVLATPATSPRASPRSAQSPTRSSPRSPTPAPSPQHGHHTRREKQAQAAAAARETEGDDAVAETGEGEDISKRKAMHHVPPQKLWTREETDALFRLCEHFDLRFIVVHDRWPDHLAVRSVDELKDRYYSVAKAVVEYRSSCDKERMAREPLALQKHCQAIVMNQFDYEYECIRKNQLERQYHRSKAELRDEEETVRNARRIEATQRRTKKERERLAKLLTPAGDILMTAANGSRVVDAKVAASATASAAPAKIFPHRKPQTGAFARSSMIYTPVTQSTRIAKKIDAVLVELDVGTRPTPTSCVVDTFDLLRMDIMSFLELNRAVAKKEDDTHLLRIKLAKLKGLPPPAHPLGIVLGSRKRKADELDNDSPLFT